LPASSRATPIRAGSPPKRSRGWVDGKPKGVEPSRLIDLVEKICDDREATTAQEKRGAGLLRGWIEDTKLDPWKRADALKALPKCDVDSAKYAAKIKTDDDDLKRAAAEVVGKPTEATGPAPDVLGPPEPEPGAVDPKAPVKAYGAADFLAQWEGAPPDKLYELFPPGNYRIDGTVIGVRDTGKGRIELELAAGKNDAVVLALAGSQAKAARSRRRGQPAKALCEFHGTAYAGYVTFEKCHWEGG
jgi:hypothetical protein